MNTEETMAQETEIEEIVYPTTDISGICDILSSHKNFLILSHTNPDGDTIGSAFALKALIRAMGADGRVIDCMEPAKRLRFMYIDQDDCSFDGDITPYDCIFSIDVASPVQLGEFEYLIPNVDLMIDHHGMGTPYALNYVDPNASAAGEIVYEIYAELKNRGLVSSVPEAARRMYAAIVSDTGSFKFSNTTPKTHIVASNLVDEINNCGDGGSDTSEVCRSLFGQRTLKELKAQALAINSLTVHHDGELGCVLFTQDMLADAGLTEDEIGNIVDTPRGLEGVLVAISLKQNKDDMTVYKVSSRANVNADCAAICAEFGGGGHTRAAGCTITAETPEKALEIAVEAFGRCIDLYHNPAPIEESEENAVEAE